MLEQIGNPLGVFDIRFPPRNSLDMLRLAKQQFHPFPLQHIPDTLPIDTSTFHRHGLATLNCEPVAEPEEIRDHGAEHLDLFLYSLGSHQKQTSNDHLLVHINPAAAVIHDLHGPSPLSSV
jgi:hypothetical protein